MEPSTSSPRPVYGRSVATPVPAHIDRNDFDHVKAPRDPNFGEPTSNTDFPGSMTGLAGEITKGRAFRMSFGLRF